MWNWHLAYCPFHQACIVSETFNYSSLLYPLYSISVCLVSKTNSGESCLHFFWKPCFYLSTSLSIRVILAVTQAHCVQNRLSINYPRYEWELCLFCLLLVLHIWYVPYMKCVFVGWINKLIIFPSTKLIPLPNFSISFLTLFLINWQRGCQGVLCFRILGPMKRMKPGIILPKGEKKWKPGLSWDR